MPEIMKVGTKEITIRYAAPTSVRRVRISLMKSEVRLPGRIPGMNEPDLRKLSAMSSGFITMEI